MTETRPGALNPECEMAQPLSPQTLTSTGLMNRKPLLRRRPSTMDLNEESEDLPTQTLFGHNPEASRAPTASSQGERTFQFLHGQLLLSCLVRLPGLG